MKSSASLAWLGPWPYGSPNIRYLHLFRRLPELHALRVPALLWHWRRRVNRRAARWLRRPLDEREPLWVQLTRSLSQRVAGMLFTPENLDYLPYAGRPVIVDDDDPEFTPAHLALLNHANVACVVTASEPLRRRLLAEGLTKPCLVIPSGVNFDGLVEARVATIRRQYNPDGKVVLGFAVPKLFMGAELAALGPEAELRNIDFLAEALELVWQAQADVLVWLIGKPSRAVEAYTVRHPQVRLLGYVPHRDIMNYYANFTIGLYPRRLDVGGRHSIKLLEYMACGLPVVTTDVAEAYLVRDSGGGVVTSVNPHDFASSILELIQDPAHRARLGARGRVFARSYSWDHIAGRFRHEAITPFLARI